MAQSVAKLITMCCIFNGLALTVDHRTSTSGCTFDDWSKFAQHFQTQTHGFTQIQPQLEEAWQKSDYAKATLLFNKITPKYCGGTDLLQMDTFPPNVKYSALQKCIRKSQGVSVACASCYPKFLESMMGKNGVMAPHSCMTKCSRMTPTTAKCLAKMQDPRALQACLTPDVQKNSIHCLECTRPKLAQYTDCLNMGFLNTDIQLNSLITTVKQGNVVSILNSQNVTDTEMHAMSSKIDDSEKAFKANDTSEEDTEEEKDAREDAKAEKNTQDSHGKKAKKTKKHHHKE